MTRVFVYGSLMTGEGNHRWLGRARLVGEARTRPEFTLHDLGSFPALVAGGETAIAGELYEVDAKILADLDRLEGHPRFYRRTPITLVDGSEAQAYLLPHGRAATLPVVISGNWKERTR